jgi:hypothetical protein
LQLASIFGTISFMNSLEAIKQARALFANVAKRLREAGATPEQLANSIPEHRMLGMIPVSETFRKAGEGFLIGALFVTSQGDVFEPKRIVRASREVAPDHQSQNAQIRRGLKDKLLGARFPENTTVLIDARPIPLDDPEALAKERGPLVLQLSSSQESVLMIRWIPSAPDSALRPLGEYLSERLELALIAIKEA